MAGESTLDNLKGWLCDKFEIACKAPETIKNAVELGVHAGAEAIVEGVKKTEPLKSVTIPALDGSLRKKQMNDLGI